MLWIILVALEDFIHNSESVTQNTYAWTTILRNKIAPNWIEAS